MGFMDWVKKTSANLSDEVKRYKNRGFMEAVVAGCAMVAFADGEATADEKSKMAGFVQRNDALSVFDTSDVVAAFDKCAKNFDFDFAIGKAEALKAISKLKKSSEESKLLVRVCCAIGAADGNFDDDEKKVVREICKELGLDPGEFEL